MIEARPHSDFSSAERMIERATLFVGSVGVAIFSATVIYTVTLRFVFNQTPYWAEELPRFLLVWVTFLGVVVATVRRSHLSAGILPLLVRDPTWRARFELLARVSILVFLAVMGWTGWQLSMMTWDSLTTALQIPMAWTYLALPVSAALACGAALISLRRH